MLRSTLLWTSNQARIRSDGGSIEMTQRAENHANYVRKGSLEFARLTAVRAVSREFSPSPVRMFPGAAAFTRSNHSRSAFSPSSDLRFSLDLHGAISTRSRSSNLSKTKSFLQEGIRIKSRQF